MVSLLHFQVDRQKYDVSFLAFTSISLHFCFTNRLIAAEYTKQINSLLKETKKNNTSNRYIFAKLSYQVLLVPFLTYSSGIFLFYFLSYFVDFVHRPKEHKDGF